MDRSRRARTYNALRRIWASVVGDDSTAQSAPADDTTPATQDAPQPEAQPAATPPPPDDREAQAQTVKAAPTADADQTEHAANSATTEPQVAAKAAEAPPADATVTEPQSASKASDTAPADATPPATSSDTFHKIEEAARDLTFMSETDAPVDAFAWSSDAPFTPDALRASASIAADEPLKTEDIDSFFRNPTTPRDWHEDAEKEQVRRFTALRDLLQAELSDITVYRFGSTAIEVYVVGRAANGSMLGIHTKVVET